MLNKNIVVIGGGPAGMMAAAAASANGACVELLEKKDMLGKKLSITGKGRCNITNAAERENFMSGYPGNGRFLYSALNELSNEDVIKFFADNGLKSKIERGNRVFPESDNAKDVVKVMEQNLINKGVKVHTSCKVTGINIAEQKVAGVEIEGKKIKADAVIIATGGMSYPGTGSTGEGYKWAIAAGHRIIVPRPGLVPLVAGETWVREVQGLSLRNVRVSSFRADGKKINEEFGEMLFTHFGVSGPIILSMSRDIGEYLYKKQKNATLLIDLKPALSEEKLDLRLQKDLEKYSRRQFKNALDDLLPRKLIPVVIRLSEIDSDKECNQITREERKKLCYLLKHLCLSIVDTRPIEEAIVTAGGVNVKEINPRTMESKLVKGLFFAGEILDVDGYTGGYNLQAAFSTGFVAGKYSTMVNS